MRKTVLLVLALSVGLGVWYYLFGSRLLQPKSELPKDINLTVWGIWDDTVVVNDVLERYHLEHPNTRVTYVKQNLLNYKTRLQAQIAAGQGPDIFMFNNSSLPVFLDYLTPAPESVFTPSDYQSAFYPVTKDSLTNLNGIWGVPFEIDGLVLFYNEDLLKAAKLSPPTSWQQFSDEARQLTTRDSSGQIQVAGAALGTTTNVDFWPEIIGLLFYQQPDAKVNSPANTSGAEVLQFYTQFVTDPKNKTWDTNLPSSTQMFKDGKLAFYFGDARKIAEIAASGPDLHFKTVPVPQVPGKNIAWANFFSFGVAKSSTHPNEAWDFLKYLTSSPSLRIIYEHQSQAGVGQPFARVDMQGILVSDPLLGAFVKQGPIYKSWYLNADSQDFGINDEMISLYQTAVDSALRGGDPLAALQPVQAGIDQTLSKYHVAK